MVTVSAVAPSFKMRSRRVAGLEGVAIAVEVSSVEEGKLTLGLGWTSAISKVGFRCGWGGCCWRLRVRGA
jgi:hypothetical protein